MDSPAGTVHISSEAEHIHMVAVLVRRFRISRDFLFLSWYFFIFRNVRSADTEVLR